jgi:hypothetical protein
MGEYGTYKGREIKIGSCEDMYYLRPDQIDKVQSPTLRDLTNIRFRFPFPDEDSVEPGDFDAYDRGVGVWDFDVPDGVEHRDVQFKSTHPDGILAMLPCPYSTTGKASGLKYQFNGYAGPVKIVQQRIWAGVWATVADCGACGSRFRLPDLESAQPLIAAALAESVKADNRRDTKRAAWWRTIGERIEAGYRTPAPPSH